MSPIISLLTALCFTILLSLFTSTSAHAEENDPSTAHLGIGAGYDFISKDIALRLNLQYAFFDFYRMGIEQCLFFKPNSERRGELVSMTSWTHELVANLDKNFEMSFRIGLGIYIFTFSQKYKNTGDRFNGFAPTFGVGFAYLFPSLFSLRLALDYSPMLLKYKGGVGAFHYLATSLNLVFRF